MRVRCGACRTQFEVAGAGRFACPVCGSINVVRNGAGAPAPAEQTQPAPRRWGAIRPPPVPRGPPNHLRHHRRPRRRCPRSNAPSAVSRSSWEWSPPSLARCARRRSPPASRTTIRSESAAPIRGISAPGHQGHDAGIRLRRRRRVRGVAATGRRRGSARTEPAPVLRPRHPRRGGEPGLPTSSVSVFAPTVCKNTHRTIKRPRGPDRPGRRSACPARGRNGRRGLGPGRCPGRGHSRG